MADSVQVFIEIKDGSKLPPKSDNGVVKQTSWSRWFATVPRYGDAYHYDYEAQSGKWSAGPGDRSMAKAFVVGIEWRPAPRQNAVVGGSDMDVPFVIIDEHDPFGKK